MRLPSSRRVSLSHVIGSLDTAANLARGIQSLNHRIVNLRAAYGSERDRLVFGAGRDEI